MLDANGQRLVNVVEIMNAIKAESPSVAEIVERHIGLLTGVEERTRKDYRRIARDHITPHLGAFPVEALHRERVKEWVNDLAPTMSPKTLHGVYALLSSAMETAISLRLHGDNPCRGVRLPRIRQQEMVLLTNGELGMILHHVPEHYRTFVRFLAGTGARWGEAIVLTVADVDLLSPTATVRINKALKRAPNGHYVGEPKTIRSVRAVSLPKTLVDELVGLAVAKESGELLFTGPRGARLHHGNFRQRVWLPAIELASAEDVGRLAKRPRIHDLRHSHASWLIAQGVDLPTVQRRLGHESITTTVDRYGHLMPDQLSKAALAADTAFTAIDRGRIVI
ncbi:MAG: tyrosine-type recombinase/integrase [Sciscionella sp.]